MLGRNAFKNLLTDIACSMCREDTGTTIMVGPDSANGGRNVSKPECLTDAIQETFDDLFESFAYDRCFKYLITEGRVDDASPPGQGQCSLHRTQLFIYIGSVRRQDGGHQLQELLSTLSTFTMDDREERDPKYLADPLDQHLQAGAPVGPSNSVSPKATSTTPVAAPLTTPAPFATGLSPSENQHNTEHITEIASYTMLLKEFGDEHGVHVTYEKERVRFSPPWWRYTVCFREVRATGEGPNQKMAKHKASKDACAQLGCPAPGL